jgi:hypothetical protein
VGFCRVPVDRVKWVSYLFSHGLFAPLVHLTPRRNPLELINAFFIKLTHTAANNPILIWYIGSNVQSTANIRAHRKYYCSGHIYRYSSCVYRLLLCCALKMNAILCARVERVHYVCKCPLKNWNGQFVREINNGYIRRFRCNSLRQV